MNAYEILWVAPITILVSVYAIYGVIALVFGNSRVLVCRKDRRYLPRITIVIPTFNEEGIIRKKLENTLETDYPAGKIDIIVIDCSTDNTPDIVTEFVKSHPFVRLVREPKRMGLAAALNKAYEMACGELVVRTDADSLLDRTSIPEIVSNLADPSVGAAIGKVVVLNDEIKEKRYLAIQDRIQIAESKLDSTFIGQSFAAFRTKLIRPVSPHSIADDTELALNIRRSGWRVVYDSAAKYYEASPEFTTARLRQKSRRALGIIRVLLANIRICFNPRFSTYGMVIMPFNFFMIVISPFLMLLIPILFVADLLTFRSFVVVDLIGLVSILLLAVFRMSRAFSSVWSLVEVQLSQLIAFKNLIAREDQLMWEKEVELRKYYAT